MQIKQTFSWMKLRRLFGNGRDEYVIGIVIVDQNGANIVQKGEVKKSEKMFLL